MRAEAERRAELEQQLATSAQRCADVEDQLREAERLQQELARERNEERARAEALLQNAGEKEKEELERAGEKKRVEELERSLADLQKRYDDA